MHRFFKEPSPHKLKYDALFPLFIDKNMGKYEKSFLKVLRAGNVATDKLKNLSGGGEGIHFKSNRFLYFTVKYRERTDKS